LINPLVNNASFWKRTKLKRDSFFKSEKFLAELLKKGLNAVISSLDESLRVLILPE